MCVMFFIIDPNANYVTILLLQDDAMSKSKMNAIICQALKQLKAEKTEKAWFMSLVTLAKLRSELFTADKIVEVLVSNAPLSLIMCCYILDLADVGYIDFFEANH